MIAWLFLDDDRDPPHTPYFSSKTSFICYNFALKQWLCISAARILRITRICWEGNRVSGNFIHSWEDSSNVHNGIPPLFSAQEKFGPRQQPTSDGPPIGQLEADRRDKASTTALCGPSMYIKLFVNFTRYTSRWCCLSESAVLSLNRQKWETSSLQLIRHASLLSCLWWTAWGYW